MIFLIRQGFNQSTSDPCLFIRNSSARKIILWLHVGGGLLAVGDKHLLEEFFLLWISLFFFTLLVFQTYIQIFVHLHILLYRTPLNILNLIIYIFHSLGLHIYFNYHSRIPLIPSKMLICLLTYV